MYVLAMKNIKYSKLISLLKDLKANRIEDESLKCERILRPKLEQKKD